MVLALGLSLIAAFGLPPKVYALGRLDADSEGLLLLSDEAGLNSRLPRRTSMRLISPCCSFSSRVWRP